MPVLKFEVFARWSQSWVPQNSNLHRINAKFQFLAYVTMMTLRTLHDPPKSQLPSVSLRSTHNLCSSIAAAVQRFEQSIALSVLTDMLREQTISALITFSITPQDVSTSNQEGWEDLYCTKAASVAPPASVENSSRIPTCKSWCESIFPFMFRGVQYELWHLKRPDGSIQSYLQHAAVWELRGLSQAQIPISPTCKSQSVPMTSTILALSKTKGKGSEELIEQSSNACGNLWLCDWSCLP